MPYGGSYSQAKGRRNRNNAKKIGAIDGRKGHPRPEIGGKAVGGKIGNLTFFGIYGIICMLMRQV